MTSSETPEQSFLDAVGDAEDAALAAVRRAWSAPGGLAGAHRRERLVTSLRIMDRDFAQWLIFDGRAKRTECGLVYLDTTALCQPGRGLPDVVEGGALALDVYLTAFAATLTDSRYCTRLIKNETEPRRGSATVRRPPRPAPPRSANPPQVDES